MEEIKRLKSMIEEAEKIVLFTGAGISVPSGIPDFRSSDGLYSGNGTRGYTPEQIVSNSFFMRYPSEFYRFYREKMVYPNAQPNVAHCYFAELEKRGKQVTVVTQNIDGLHQKAGSMRVLELHGSVHRNYCMRCGKRYNLNEIIDSAEIPHCACGGIIRPDVVLYEESLDYDVITQSLSAIKESDLLMIVGTSLAVQPAASFISYARGNRVLINKGETASSAYADLIFRDGVENVVRALQAAESQDT